MPGDIELRRWSRRARTVESRGMKAISIRQPWAWLIINGWQVPSLRKDIENRSWPTKLRGRVLVHASARQSRREYDAVSETAKVIISETILLPAFEDLPRGGIIGSVEILDCVTESSSPWFTGPYGFVLANPETLPFRPHKGALGFFEVPA